MRTPVEIPEWLVAQSNPPPPPPVDDHRVEDLVNNFIAGKQDALFEAPDAYYRTEGADALDGAPKRIAWVTIAVLFAPVGLFVYVLGDHMLRFVGVLQPWDFPNICATKSSVKRENVGGLDFEFEVVDCLMDEDTIRMIFVSHHGQHQRHRLTVYGDTEQMPTATLVAPHTAPTPQSTSRRDTRLRKFE